MQLKKYKNQAGMNPTAYSPPPIITIIIIITNGVWKFVIL